MECPQCGGRAVCVVCEGRGLIFAPPNVSVAPVSEAGDILCPVCRGTGACPACSDGGPRSTPAAPDPDA